MADDDVRVVVVDDASDVAEAMSLALQLNGYHVRVAHDGLEALAVIDEHRPVCVLLDIDLPGLDGAELSRRLRERYGDEMVLVAMTGWDPKDPRVAETFIRVDHYLQKPVDPDEIRRLLPHVHD